MLPENVLRMSRIVKPELFGVIKNPCSVIGVLSNHIVSVVLVLKGNKGLTEKMSYIEHERVVHCEFLAQSSLRTVQQFDLFRNLSEILIPIHRNFTVVHSLNWLIVCSKHSVIECLGVLPLVFIHEILSSCFNFLELVQIIA